MCLYFQPGHTVKLLTILKLMLDKHGPDVYFNFSGQEGGVSGHVVFFFFMKDEDFILFNYGLRHQSKFCLC